MKDLPTHLLRNGLERIYQACLASEPNIELIIFLHHYIQYINEHPILDYLFTENIQKDARELTEKIRKQERSVEKELDVVYKRLLKIVADNKIDDTSISSALSDYPQYKSGRHRSSLGKIESMFNQLRDVVEYIHNSPNKSLITDYIIPTKTSQGRAETLKIDISDSFNRYMQYKDRFRRIGEVSAWGAFDIIFMSYRTINAYAYEEYENKSVINDTTFFASMAESAISNGTHKETARQAILRGYSTAVLTRLHISVLNELDKYEQSPEKTHKIKHARIEPEIKTENNRTLVPEVVEEYGFGFFKRDRNSPKIRIGKVNTRRFRLLKVLIYPLGTRRTVGSVFDEIKINRDSKDAKLKDSATAHQRQVKLITWAVKELQKIEQMQGIFRIQFTPDNQRLVYLEVF